MNISLFHVDAFTERPFRGNPAAVCFLDSWLDEGWLRKVAAENNVSATAFLVNAANGYELRWFTAKCELKLCGHATLASAHVLLNIRGNGLNTVTFNTRFRGDLRIKKGAEALIMDFPAIAPRPLHTIPAILREALQFDSIPVEVLEANETYIAVTDSPAEIRSFRPNFAILEQLHPFVVAVTARGTDSDFVSRYFAPSYGIPEDPVTGSVHCALAPYWASRLGKSTLHARQLSERGGELWCEVRDDRILLKGKAVLTLEGSLSI